MTAIEHQDYQQEKPNKKIPCQNEHEHYSMKLRIELATTSATQNCIQPIVLFSLDSIYIVSSNIIYFLFQQYSLYATV